MKMASRNTGVINIISLNVRGLREATKRRAIFSYYRTRCNILCLQETHSDEKTIDMWRNEWGGRCYASHGETNARGVAIMVNKECTAKIDLVMADNDGRVIACNVHSNDTTVCVANIYAPNKDSPKFFEDNFRKIQEVSEKSVVIGDFNTVLDAKYDRLNPRANVNSNSSAKINQLMEEYMLADPWRQRNPGVRRYSWMQAAPQRQGSRIDMAIMSLGLCKYVHDTYYITGIYTDHSALFVGLELTTTERGGGYWKLNVSLLGDLEFVKGITQEIKQLKTDLEGVPAAEKWELIKRGVKKQAQKLSKVKMSDEKIAISQLSEYITHTENEYHQLSDEQIGILHKSKQDLEILLSEQSQRIMFRSKAKWYMEGERNTRYFFNMEKAKYNAKVCSKLINDEGNEVNSRDEVMNVQYGFYADLYQADCAVEMNLDMDPPPHEVDPLSAGASELHFNVNEVKHAIKQMKNGSCPGSDGLPVEFYKCFWEHIHEEFMDAMEGGFKDGLMHETARTGILNLIPKGDKDVRMLKNLRPITLLNCDYKIIEKCIANRMVPSLVEIIHEDHKGFLPKRRISANIRKVLDIVIAAEQEGREITVMSCDFMKCFDRIEQECVIAGLKYFKFSSVICHWVETLYSQFSVRIQNSGFFTEGIPVTRSIHQGGPASNALFLVVAELLAINLRRDNRIKAAFVKEMLHLLNQFADDLDVFQEFDQESMDQVMWHFNRFQESTGFQLNYEKTTLYRLGSLKNSDAKLYTQSEMRWTNESINVLGVDVYHCQEQTVKVNYAKVMQKAKNTLAQWSRRNLSMCGKIAILNTLVASLFVYKMSVLPVVSPNLVKEFEEMCNHFIWNAHKPKIGLHVLKTTKEHGGMQLVDIMHRDLSIKASWVVMLKEGVYPEEFVYKFMYPELGSLIWCCNISPGDVEKFMNIVNQFWKDVMYAWAKYHYEGGEIESDQILWWNSEICVGGKPLWNPSACAKGLIYASQMYEEGVPISVENAAKKYGLTTMQRNSYIDAMSAQLKLVAKMQNVPFVDPKYARVVKAKNPTQVIYAEICPISDRIVQNEIKLQQEFDDGEDVDIVQAVQNI